LDDSNELLRRCQRGDDRALTDLVRSYQDRIYRLACRVTGNTALAEEATAQALAKIWARAGQWRESAAAGTWIYRLAVRTVLDVQRGQRRWWKRWSGPWPRVVADRDAGPAEKLTGRDEEAQRARRLHQALQALSENDRALVHLYYFEGRGLPEIAPILGASREALKVRLARAREKLRTLLETDEFLAR